MKALLDLASLFRNDPSNGGLGTRFEHVFHVVRNSPTRIVNSQQLRDLGINDDFILSNIFPGESNPNVDHRRRRHHHQQQPVARAAAGARNAAAAAAAAAANRRDRQNRPRDMGETLYGRQQHRRKRREYTEEEKEAIRRGIRAYGRSLQAMELILRSEPLLRETGRTAVKLYDHVRKNKRGDYR